MLMCMASVGWRPRDTATTDKIPVSSVRATAFDDLDGIRRPRRYSLTPFRACFTQMRGHRDWLAFFTSYLPRCDLALCMTQVLLASLLPWLSKIVSPHLRSCLLSESRDHGNLGLLDQFEHDRVPSDVRDNTRRTVAAGRVVHVAEGGTACATTWPLLGGRQRDICCRSLNSRGCIHSVHRLIWKKTCVVLHDSIKYMRTLIHGRTTMGDW